MKICRWHLACTRSRPLALQLWASRGQKVKNVKMRKEREGTKAIEKKMPAGPKIENDWKKQVNQKIDMTDEIDAAMLAMQFWQLLIMFSIEDNISLYMILILTMLTQCWQNVNFTLCRLGSIFFAPFDRYRIYFSSLLSFFHARWNCCGLDPVAKMPRRRKMKPLCAQFNTPLHIVMQSCTQIDLL